MRWRWQWDENYLSRTQRENAKEEGKSKHQHMKPAQNGQLRKGKRKEKKGETDGNRTRPATRGKTEAPEPTWHGANLQQPQHATGQTYLESGERMMHPQRMQSLWGLGIKLQPSGRLKSGAQCQPHRDTRKESHQRNGCEQSLELRWKEIVVLASNCTKVLEEKVRHVKHIDRWEPKKASSSLYSDELLIQKYFSVQRLLAFVRSFNTFSCMLHRTSKFPINAYI